MKSAALKKIVLIGASTGGPGQIQKIISSLPKLSQVSVIVAQHMVEGFLQSYASGLQEKSKNHVTIIHNNHQLQSGTVYIAQGITELNYKQLIFQTKKASSSSYNPDINVLFNSLSPLCKDMKVLSVLLTGIGSDGVEACINLSKSGSTCITESEESAIVDGMPNRARALVPNIQIYGIDEIIKKISEFCDV